jgi:hypothetical protein
MKDARRELRFICERCVPDSERCVPDVSAVSRIAQGAPARSGPGCSKDLRLSALRRPTRRQPSQTARLAERPPAGAESISRLTSPSRRRGSILGRACFTEVHLPRPMPTIQPRGGGLMRSVFSVENQCQCCLEGGRADFDGRVRRPKLLRQLHPGGHGPLTESRCHARRGME